MLRGDVMWTRILNLQRAAIVICGIICVLVAIAAMQTTLTNKYWLSSKYRVVVTKRFVQMPDEHNFVQIFHINRYFLFNDIYPNKWPMWLRLPPHTYMSYNGGIEIRSRAGELFNSNKRILRYSSLCIIEMSKTELVDYFRDIAKNADVDTAFNKGKAWTIIDFNSDKDFTYQIEIRVAQLDEYNQGWSFVVIKEYY